MNRRGFRSSSIRRPVVSVEEQAIQGPMSCARRRGRRQKYNIRSNHNRLTCVPFGWPLPEAPRRLLIGANRNPGRQSDDQPATLLLQSCILQGS